jgi:glucosamine--fructose-6-phosphate aminotransferase (isomerizing)
MCGIVAYIGNNSAAPILVKGLKRLEYRGYDSAGIALMQQNKLEVVKKMGRVVNMESAIESELYLSTIGMGHTRWATHGEPSDRNAHPHRSQNGKMAIIHNGIIENYKSIKCDLETKGHVFSSDTDTEVLIHLIEELQFSESLCLEEAVRVALLSVTGAYAIVVMSEDEPNQLIVARKGSPLLIGIGKEEFFVASDATPLIGYTKEVIYLNDAEMGILSRGIFEIKSLHNEQRKPLVKKLEVELSAIEKGDYEHFMLKEIMEQPHTIFDSMRGRLLPFEGRVVLGGLEAYKDTMLKANRFIMLACGTSLHAGMVGRYFFEEICKVSAEAEYASEFRYRQPVVRKSDVIIAISQSGETADTLVAIDKAKELGAGIFGICNVVGSSIARKSDAGIYTHAGAEIGVASTKAFTAQLSALFLLGLQLAKEKGTLDQDVHSAMLHELNNIPAKVQRILDNKESIAGFATLLAQYDNMIYLGRGFNFPIALEGALKMKEITYIHAEGYPAAEMKHGPIALVDENTPVIFIAPKDGTYEKIISNMQEVKARKGKILAIVTEGDAIIPEIADYVIEIPATIESFTPLLTIIPLQLLAYYVGLQRGCNIDQPRNLAKSVTVE